MIEIMWYIAKYAWHVKNEAYVHVVFLQLQKSLTIVPLIIVVL